jgi:hypothetical protein
MVLFVGALAHWPWASSRLSEPSRLSGDITPSLAMAALSVLIRPQIILLWLFVGIVHLNGLRSDPTAARQLVLGRVLPIGCAAVLCQLFMDRCFYHEWTFSPWNFFVFNVIQVQYGC